MSVEWTLGQPCLALGAGLATIPLGHHEIQVIRDVRMPMPHVPQPLSFSSCSVLPSSGSSGAPVSAQLCLDRSIAKALPALHTCSHPAHAPATSCHTVTQQPGCPLNSGQPTFCFLLPSGSFFLPFCHHPSCPRFTALKSLPYVCCLLCLQKEAELSSTFHVLLSDPVAADSPKPCLSP